MQYCMQLEAGFSSEIIWTDVLNVRRWKQRSKNDEKSFMPIEAKIAAKSRRVSMENIQQVVTMIGQFTADSRVGSRNQCTPAD